MRLNDRCWRYCIGRLDDFVLVEKIQHVEYDNNVECVGDAGDVADEDVGNLEGAESDALYEV